MSGKENPAIRELKDLKSIMISPDPILALKNTDLEPDFRSQTGAVVHNAMCNMRDEGLIPTYENTIAYLYQKGCKHINKEFLKHTDSVMPEIPMKPGVKQENGETKPFLTLQNAHEIIPVPIRWLWKDYLAKGKLHIFAGPAGTGKTTIAINILSVISAGHQFPDGSVSPQGNTIIWSGEDDPQDTLVPRALANGANPKNIYFVGDVQQKEQAQSFDPSRHMSLLDSAIEKVGSVALIVIDPIVNAVINTVCLFGQFKCFFVFCCIFSSLIN